MLNNLNLLAYEDEFDNEIVVKVRSTGKLLQAKIDLQNDNKAKVKLKAKKYNPVTRKHEIFVEKKLQPHSKK